MSQFIDLLYKIKHNNNTEKQTKNICSLKQKDKSDADPLVDKKKLMIINKAQLKHEYI